MDTLRNSAGDDGGEGPLPLRRALEAAVDEARRRRAVLRWVIGAIGVSLALVVGVVLLLLHHV
jgi:cell division septal protein FtsQ